MKKNKILLVAVVAGVCATFAGLVYAACNIESTSVEYELEPSISGSNLVPQGVENTYSCSVSASIAGYTPTITDYTWSGGGNPAGTNGPSESTFSTRWASSGSNTLKVAVRGSDLDVESALTVECTNTTDFAVTVVKIASVVAETNVICYLKNVEIEGTPDPTPDFPVGTPVWKKVVGGATNDLGSGDSTTYYTPTAPSSTHDDIKIIGECGTSSESDTLTAVGVTGMGFTTVSGGAVDTDTLGFSPEQGTATATVSPSGRTLVWSWEVVSAEGSIDPDIDLTPSADTQSATVKTEPGSGSGEVKLIVVDADTRCGWYRIIKVGCSSCSSSGTCDPMGAASIHVDSVNAEFSLGGGRRGSSAGSLTIIADEMSSGLARPSLESIEPSEGPVHKDDCEGKTKGHGEIEATNARYLPSQDDNKLLRQVKVPDGLVDIQVVDDFRYDMSFYMQSAVGPKDQDGYYTTNGAPKVTYIIENPDASTNVFNRLRISKVVGSETNVSEYVYTQDGGTNNWKLTTGNDLKSEQVSEYSDGVYSNTLRTISGGTGDVTSVVLTKNYDFAWGSRAVERVTDPEGAALTTSWSYYTNSAENGYGRIAMQVNPDGSWQKYDYTSEGYPLVTIRGYKDTPTNATASEARATYYDYSIHAGETAGYRPSTARTVTETLLGVTNSVTYRAFTTNGNGERVEITERAATASSSYGDTNNLRSISTYYADDADEYSASKVKSMERPEGTLTSYTYENGLLSITDAASGDYSFTAGGTNEYLRTTVTRGTTANPAGIAGETTREVTITAPLGGTLVSESQVYTGSGYERINWRMNVLDKSHRPVAVYNSDGTQSTTVWACCGKESETDQQGLETTYIYDDLERVEMMTRELGSNVVYTTYSYDAAGRRLSTLTQAGTLSQSSSNRYNLAGQLVASTDAQGIVTTYSYPNDGRDRITVRAGVTNATYSYLDGRTHYTEINGERKQTYDYGVNADGTTWTVTYTGPSYPVNPVDPVQNPPDCPWVKTTTDMLGRTIKTERPGYSSVPSVPSVVETFNTYNTKGQLISQSMVYGLESNVSLFAYNDLGQQIQTAKDINTNGVIDLAGPDRVNASDRSYEQDGGDWWMKSVSVIYPEDGSATPLTNSIQRQRLTGLGTPLVVPPSGGSPLLVSETISIDIRGNQTTQKTHIDRANKTVTQMVDSPVSTNDQMQITVNGLLTEQTSATGITTTYGYDALGRRTSMTDGRGNTMTTAYNSKGQVEYTEDGAGNRTTYGYDVETGRRISTTDALTNSTYQAYSAEGQLVATWGATYPVYYEYDEFDRMSAMYTYRGTNEISAFQDFSLSAFDKTSWFYDEATGLLTNKLYSDGNGTAYTYTPQGQLETRTWARGITTTYSYDTCCNALTNITYSDSTPSVTYKYDRLGRQTSVTDAQGTRTFAYDPDTLAQTSETIVSGGITNVITRTQDDLGRANGLTLGSDYAVTYDYDTVGRFHSVSSSVYSVYSVVNYDYLPGSSLISSVSNSAGFASLREYEEHRNLITDIDNQWNSSTVSSFAYENDAVGRRTERIDATSSLAVTNTFGYNTRSEVIEAVMPALLGGGGTNRYNYAYDPIENRRSASKTTDDGQQTTDYVANMLNQYTNIANSVTNMPTYDEDGNMTSYGDTTFAWNGENRLIKTESAASVPDAAKVKVENLYDYGGRRVRKTVSSDYSGGTYTTTNVSTYVWDGFNIIAEMCDAGYTNWYTYGLDLSGTLQGAGGVGGALAMTRDTGTATNTYLYCFDGNGNVVNLVDAGDGSIAATYEYSPFGSLIRSTGTMADDNPVRWSTKHTDDETGLVMYEYRPYSPTLGRFINRDPLLNAPRMQRYATQVLGEGHNLYMFVKNAPVFHVDPFGLAGCSASKCCECKSISVTFAPGGASFGGVVLNTGLGRFGNTIHVVHTVKGDPTKCSYKHIESGTYWWDTPYGAGTGSGTTSDATTAASVVWECDSFEYWDRLGLTKPTPLLSGDYFMGFSDDFTMQMTCTGTDGVTISSPVYPITGNYLDTVP